MRNHGTPLTGLLCLYVLLAVISIAIKCLIPLQQDEASARTEWQQRMIGDLDRSGLTLTGRYSLSTGAEYQISAFSARDCQQHLYLLPMYRNAEAGHLLAQTLGPTPNFHGYFYRGRFYRRFPHWQYLWHEKLRRPTGWRASARPVLSYAENGNCGMYRQLAALTF